MKWKRKEVLLIASLLLAGLALRLVLLHFRPPVSGDSLVYGDIAANLLRHGAYSLTVDGTLHPTLIRLPGYPLFLAGCFALFGAGNYFAAVWVQIVLSLCQCCLSGLLAYRLMGRRAGWFALGLSATCPFTANYSVVPLTESLALFSAMLAFFSLERWKATRRNKGAWNYWLLPVAFAGASAGLLRPDRALLCFVMVGALVWMAAASPHGQSFRRLGPSCFVAMALALPLSIWALRNWRAFHVIQPLAPKYANDPGDEVARGFMRWYRTWGIDYKNTVEVYWPYDGSLVAFSNIPARAFDSARQRDDTAQLFTRYNDETSSTPEIDRGFSRLAADRISAHPVRYYVALPVLRLLDMWLQPRTELLRMPLDWLNWRAHPGKTAFSAGYAMLNLAYLILALAGLRKWRGRAWSGQRELAYAMIGFVVLRSVLLATLDNAEQRYTIDCFPVVLLLAGLAFARKQTAISAELESLSC